MKNYLVALLAAISLFTALPASTQTPSITNVAFSGTSFFTSQPATATVVSPAIKLPFFTGTGTLNVTEAGITGSPSGCTITLAFQGNNSPTAAAVTSTLSFTPATGVQAIVVNPVGMGVGDQYVATYACSSAYPTAGTITLSFSPSQASVISNVGDPCLNPNVAKSSVTVSTSGAGTTQLVALSGTKVVYVCNLGVGISATTATLALEYGTGASCGTGTTALTGTIVPTAGMWLMLGWGGTVASSAAGNALCVVNGGTGTQIGVLTYVQQ